MNRRELSCAHRGVPPSEITVIIHGPILKDAISSAPQGMTLAAVQSVKKVIPGARVLISTWAGSEAESLGADQVVYSADPGCLPYGKKARANNVNRQIIAMSSGLDLVKTKWVLKLRSDTILTSDSMFKRWGQYRERNRYLRVFKERIITSALLTYHPRTCFQGGRFTPFLFHVNDMIQFGLAEDMRKLWCIPLMPSEDFNYFTEAQLSGKIDKIGNRRVPEDYIWTSVLSSFGYPTNDSWADFQPAMVPVSELSIVNNFHLRDHHDMGFTCLKYPDFGNGYHLIGSPYFSYREWCKLYRTYCDPTISLPAIGRTILPAICSNPFAFLNLNRLGQLMKSLSRPARHRIKSALRVLHLWK